MRLWPHSRRPDCIIIEGPSAVGKGTLIRRLKWTEPHREYLHFGKAPDDILRFYLSAAATPWPTIVDRWALSNLVYAPIVGNQPLLSEEQREELEVQMLVGYGCSVKQLVLVASPQTLSERNAGRDKPSSDPFMAYNDAVCRAYGRRRLRRIPTGYVKTDGLTPDEVYEQAVIELERP